MGIGRDLAKAAAILAGFTSQSAGRTAIGAAAASDVSAIVTIPVGTMLPYAGGAAPANFALCFGQAVSRTTYAALFAIIGTTYGTGDGSTTFNLPDMRGRVAAGADNMGGTAANRLQVTTTITTTAGSATATVGSAAGLSLGMAVLASTVPAGVTITAISGATVTLSSGTSVTAGTATAARFTLVTDPQALGSAGGGQTHQLVTAQMPAHTHTAGAVITGRNTSSAGGEAIVYQGSTNATSSTGGDQAHPNVQPTLVANYIIRIT